jgi:hypothetical protein
MAFLDETGLAELWSLVKAEDAKVLAADVKVVTGTYTGNGTSDSSGGVTLTFERAPRLLIVSSNVPNTSRCNSFLILFGNSYITGYSNRVSGITVEFNGNTAHWYGDSDVAILQNASGSTYKYFAIF